MKILKSLFILLYLFNLSGVLASEAAPGDSKEIAEQLETSTIVSNVDAIEGDGEGLNKYQPLEIIKYYGNSDMQLTSSKSVNMVMDRLG